MTYSSLPHFPLKSGRAHEVCGAGAFVFAFALAAHKGGKIIWVREGWEPTQINPNGSIAFVDPADLIICQTKTQSETLAVAEEALRSGAASLVVMTLGKPLGLTEGRRLQLAARDGASTGLAVIPDGMGSNAAETRWRCNPTFDPKDSTHQKWELIKNKSGTLGVWYVRWDTASRRLVMVSPAGN
ncbi:hypothetical protein V8J82_09765 [Gymnodinialimonas sp. 2305UL16-5]|uniref:ImuA family protein n=1 Tax=Gymnodinialimonas mytili TaxID=3126503 RepID=UPI003097BCAC